MKFGKIPVDNAFGAINAHSVSIPNRVIKKGARLTADDCADLMLAGISHVIAARLDDDDLHEDDAAERIAQAAAGDHARTDPPFTGRANIFAEAAGILQVDAAAIDAVNGLDPAITFATLPAFAAIEKGRMIATAKIIPFAVSQAKVDAAEKVLAGSQPAVSVAPFHPKNIAVLSTTLASLKPSVVDKTVKVLAERLAIAEAQIIHQDRMPHEPAALANALSSESMNDADLIIIFGASAVVDIDDVIPAAIRLAGGSIDHFGMPVDPGNLLLIGQLAGKPVIGAPGCARSPKENGFDWVLQRLLADLPVTGADLTAMGVGGLLMEIVSRPQPRAAPATAGQDVAAIVLAAGRSSRMGGPNKMLATMDGVPLVRIAAVTALQSRASHVIVVTGHMHDQIAEALAGLDVELIDNPDFADGLSTSMRAGLAQIPDGCDAAIFLLGDMPFVTADDVDRLIEAYQPATGALIVLPTHNGKRGNPVLWSRRFFADLAEVHGDVGGRHLIGGNPEAVVEVELGPVVGQDLDTPDALAKAGGRLPDEQN